METVITIIGGVCFAILLLVAARVAMLASVTGNVKQAYQLYVLCVFWKYHPQIFLNELLPIWNAQVTLVLDKIKSQTGDDDPKRLKEALQVDELKLKKLLKRYQVWGVAKLSNALLKPVQNVDPSVVEVQFKNRTQLDPALFNPIIQQLLQTHLKALSQDPHYAHSFSASN